MINFLLKELSLPYNFMWQSFIRVRKVKQHLLFFLMVTTSFCTCSMCKTAFRVPLPLMRAKNRWFLCKLRIPSHSKKKTRKHFVRRQEMQNNSRVGSCLCVRVFMATLLTVTSSVLLIKIKPNLICCLILVDAQSCIKIKVVEFKVKVILAIGRKTLFCL